MRGSRWFIIGIVLFLLIMFVVEYHLPKKFVWNPTFGQHDHQPLGGAVFDDVLMDIHFRARHSISLLLTAAPGKVFLSLPSIWIW